MRSRRCFNSIELEVVSAARARAAALVTDYYRVAPREWRQMRYEVKTLSALDSSEITDAAMAQTLCYGFKREVGSQVLEEGDLYRICIQDHRVLDVARNTRTRLDALLTYVLTHELVHVVRFGQRLERADLPIELHAQEEQRVEKTTRAILTKAEDSEIKRILSGELAGPR